MKIRKLQVPIKTKKAPPRPKLRRRVVAKKRVKRTISNVKMPEMVGFLGGGSTSGLGDAGGGFGEIGFTMPEINFFGVKQQGEKVVFLVHAGPATTKGQDKKQSPKSRMTFYTIRKRLTEMIDALPDYTLFNSAVYWQNHTTPFSPEMVLATDANKEKHRRWVEPLNPLELEETYGSGFDRIEGFHERVAELGWPTGCLTNNLPPFGPAWIYNYRASSKIRSFYGGGADYGCFMNWARALAFAMEQKPDTIFILCTGYVIGQDDPGMMADSFYAMADYIYRGDKKSFPTVNVVVLTKVGASEDGASVQEAKFSSIVDKFHGQSEIIGDIRDVMTPEELEELSSLTGSL